MNVALRAVQSDVDVEPPGDLRLSSLLAMSPLRGAQPEVLSGHGNLDRPIRWVHAGEVPGITALLHGGELLLTTGLGMVPKALWQRQFIDGAADHGVAGIVLELGFSLREAPPAMVARAVERNLPFIVLHRPVHFAEVTEVAQRAILGGRLGASQRVDAAHRDLMTRLLGGADVVGVLRQMVVQTGTSLVLERADGRILYHATAPADDEHAMLTVRADAHARGLELETVEVPGGSRSRGLRLVAPSREGSLSTVDRAVLERGADLLALALLRARQEEVLSARERGDFLRQLIDDALAPQELETRARDLGWHGAELLMPVVLELRSRHLAGQQEVLAAVIRDAEAEMRSQRVPFLAGIVEDGTMLAAVVGLPDADRRSLIAARTTRTLRALIERHRSSGMEVAACVGAVSGSWPETGRRLREALDLAPTALADDCWVDLMQPDVDRLLRGLAGDSALERFVQRRLGPVIAYDKDRHSELVRTLETLFAHDGNKADTARALHLERQSLYHRLERIEELLGDSLSDESTRLGVHLALRARRACAA